ncbi:MAG TPA: ABC transporter ATP-binding protein [Rectinemataceae bacterium]|nr:ABC transporter ATP-binding protein [Rectinemataceae bacterium]
MSEALLKVERLSAGYGEMQVLLDVCFEVRPGEIVSLVGSNGAGKTTLMRALSGLLPRNGSIRFAGSEISGMSAERIFSLGLVQVPEGRQLFGQMSVLDNLLMGAYLCRDRKEVERRLARVFELFPFLRERRGQRAGVFSGGEQQIIAIARALMADPKLLMVDEMSLGLAPVMVDKLLDSLSAIRDERGVTVLLVEQDVFSAFSIADRGYVLEMGQVVREGKAKELVEDPEVRRAYLGI